MQIRENSVALVNDVISGIVNSTFRSVHTEMYTNTYSRGKGMGYTLCSVLQKVRLAARWVWRVTNNYITRTRTGI